MEPDGALTRKQGAKEALKNPYRGLPKDWFFNSQSIDMPVSFQTRSAVLRQSATKRAFWLFFALLGVSSVFAPIPARADTPTTYVFPEQNLRFGRFAVYGSGTRTVSTAGVVTDTGGIVAATGEVPGPAQFSVGYNRGNEGNSVLTVTLQIVVGAVPPFTNGGVTATVSNLTSTLPGAATVTPGQIITVTVRNCRVRYCGTTFQLGGRITASRLWGGAQISTPIPVTVTVTAVK